VTAPRPARSKASRRRRRRIKTRSLVLLAVAGCLALLVGRGSAQIVGQFSCTNDPVTINVAVSTDISPAIQRVADVFDNQHRRADGKCIAVEVTAMPSAQATAQIEHSHPTGVSEFSAWIPDSSLWVNQATTSPAGATIVQPAGFSVARSPLMIVMPSAAAAAQVPAFGKDGWRLLIPQSAGGPAVPSTFRVDLPDPTQSSAGLSTLIEVGRLLGPAARIKFTKFVLASEVTPYFDNPISLKYFASLAAPPLDSLPATVTTEQAVIAYDAAYPREPLAATYPAGSSAEFGTPILNYPYVTTTANPQRYAAAKAFGRMLRGSFAQSVIRYAGFRTGSGAGVPDRVATVDGLTRQLLQVAPPATTGEAPSALQAFSTLAYGSRILAMVDVSSAMAKATVPGGPTLEKELAQTASLGLPLFADSTDVGEWEFASHLNGKLPYRQLVPVGPLDASLGLITRRDELQKVSAAVHTVSGRHTALYGSILDAYTYMQQTYNKKFVNSVVVLTSGQENAPGDISGADLLRKLTKLDSSGRKVNIIIIIFGSSPHFAELKQIAQTTGGQAYQITNPAQIGKVFFRALAHRLCQSGCVAP
jgi:Ca-activated chloride channel homolog